MPREAVKYGRQVDGSEEGDGSEVYETPTLQVNWHDNPEIVQVQLKCDPRYLRLALEHGDEAPTLTSDILSRKDVNYLIRTLRRARDRAYGADA